MGVSGLQGSGGRFGRVGFARDGSGGDGTQTGGTSKRDGSGQGTQTDGLDHGTQTGKVPSNGGRGVGGDGRHGGLNPTLA